MMAQSVISLIRAKVSLPQSYSRRAKRSWQAVSQDNRARLRLGSSQNACSINTALKKNLFWSIKQKTRIRVATGQLAVSSGEPLNRATANPAVILWPNAGRTCTVMDFLFVFCYPDRWASSAEQSRWAPADPWGAGLPGRQWGQQQESIQVCVCVLVRSLLFCPHLHHSAVISDCHPDVLDSCSPSVTDHFSALLGDSSAGGLVPHKTLPIVSAERFTFTSKSFAGLRVMSTESAVELYFKKTHQPHGDVMMKTAPGLRV